MTVVHISGGQDAEQFVKIPLRCLHFLEGVFLKLEGVSIGIGIPPLCIVARGWRGVGRERVTMDVARVAFMASYQSCYADDIDRIRYLSLQGVVEM